MTTGEHDKSQESQPGNSQAENVDGVTPADPTATDPYATGESATGQLQQMLETDFDPSQHKEEEVELAADKKDAKIDWTITGIAGVLVAAVVIWGLAFRENFAEVSGNALSFVVDNFGWAFVLFTAVFVVFVICIAASKFGTIKLGAINEEPEFSTVSWIAMMFAAGMGIGLMFYGASEPLAFYRDGVPGHEPNEVGTAMATAMFHWTLHPWAVYAIVGLAIAYSTFRIGRKQLLSSAFVPLIGEKGANGPIGKLIDILAIFATVFGTACSLGLGALQIQAGLEASGMIENASNSIVIGIVLVLTLAFILSALSGVGKGIQYLSNANMVMAAFLAIFVFVLGPSVTILNMVPSSIGNYLSSFTEMIGRTAESADGTAGEWLSGWTIFYWAWWISWSPFVGMFLARISRGRSVREFCLGVLLVPAGVSTIWFAIFGGTAIHMEQQGQSISGESTEEELFNLLQSLPMGTIAAFVAMILLGTFFITSADSASTVMGSMSQNGRSNATPWLSAVWGALTAAVGLVLLLTGEDALNNLQNVTIVAASPFLIVLIFLMFAIVKDLRNDVIYVEYREAQAFQRKLARERRIHREVQEKEEHKRRRSEMIGKVKKR
ncbi:BCCT family transporter [Corynebacterium sp. L4756]|uniref:BCCT family transporter n=1 Tax=unclassified Corynebacterium TaxID=2624378 RepID=UPI00374DBE8F